MYLSLFSSTPVFSFLIHMSIMWICVISHVKLAGQLYEYDVDQHNESCSARWLASRQFCAATLDITHKIFNQILSYLPCLKQSLTSTILYHFLWPWLQLGVTLSAYSKTSRFDSEGSRPEWCISSMIYSRDTPFWSGILDFSLHCSTDQDKM